MTTSCSLIHSKTMSKQCVTTCLFVDKSELRFQQKRGSVAQDEQVIRWKYVATNVMSQCKYNTDAYVYKLQYQYKPTAKLFLCCHYESIISPVKLHSIPDSPTSLALEGSGNLLSHAQSTNHNCSVNSIPCDVMFYI